ncbi:hypothetical protein CAOG_05475 [Capsaspora owczarzaki ATCC 30864]|uniref:UBA-like domain-containing protein n=1 Tax=Capsaspora owczarzaki (strain ATCC 30864) TaxID=595528 RepID=A0A0D2WS64_CAPO3|nr:hypothetical protein CAOG_05475 [Capsaspora owczarzaki ATCC 30864]KJE94935.1 hypothetical protein CAOG_005475 [Capsaspora owczarzaki ATCC 30864]|eukprot:XP_004346148.2 hypothetical protein CAOG_05475 [Capsaspora owczarzaki ATCC 30864]
MDATSLRNQAMMNQFVHATGCTWAYAQTTLEACKWNMEVALSAFYQQIAPPPGMQSQSRYAQQNTTPSNTPATPPQFPDALAGFKSMSMRVENK